jgi:hypothetical protein
MVSFLDPLRMYTPAEIPLNYSVVVQPCSELAPYRFKPHRLVPFSLQLCRGCCLSWLLLVEAFNLAPACTFLVYAGTLKHNHTIHILFRPYVILRLVPLAKRHHEHRLPENIAKPKCAEGDKDTDRIGEVVESGDSQRHRHPHVPKKAGKIGTDREYICDVGAEVPAVIEVVDARFTRSVQVWYFEVASSHDVVVAEEDSSDRREENLIGRKEFDEYCG